MFKNDVPKDSVMRRHAEATLEFVRATVAATGKPPTFREIGVEFGFSRTTAEVVVAVLVEQGRVSVQPRVHRGIQLIGPKVKRPRP